MPAAPEPRSDPRRSRAPGHVGWRRPARPRRRARCSPPPLEEQGGPKVELEIDLPDGTRLPAKRETAIFRVTQEALTNVVKHAEAETVRITLVSRERSVVLAIEDDGRGFSEARTRDGGFGLVGMRERVTSLNGSLDIESQRRVGTRIFAEIPLP